MKIIRWILYVPIGIASFLLSIFFVPYILAFLWKILYFVIFWGTRYDMPSLFDFEYTIADFKTFIFTTCLGTVISGGLSGAIAGYIAPNSKYPGVTTTIYAIPLVCLLVKFGYAAWNSEHWFYSGCMEITLIITGFLGIVFAYIKNCNE
jgi:hypothetical protein